MRRKNYLKRIVDTTLEKNLSAMGAVLIEGPKWCGKTWTAENQATSTIFIQDPAEREQYLALGKLDPGRLLAGETPRLIDEWQVIPSLWDAVRYEVDRRGESGQFILTGSSTPEDSEEIFHTGTGRIARITMRSMSLYESLESNGAVSLGSLLDGNTEVATDSNLSLEAIAFAAARGGWPQAVTKNNRDSFQMSEQYIKQIAESDISRVDGTERNPDRASALIRSLARNTATVVSNKTIINDLASFFTDSISEKTLDSYLNALKRIFILDELRAWAPAIQSKTPMRKAPKRTLVDPSLVVAALQIDDKYLLDNPIVFGQVFECLCLRDLRIYAEALGGTLRHYRDANGLEIDAIISMKNGKWGAVEIKLGDYQYDQAAENLLKFRDKMTHTDGKRNQIQPPSFLMIVSGSKYAYRREDGVVVCPIGCLKP